MGPGSDSTSRLRDSGTRASPYSYANRPPLASRIRLHGLHVVVSLSIDLLIQFVVILCLALLITLVESLKGSSARPKRFPKHSVSPAG